ncbi:MAG TPA: hypothetical protein VK820_00005, partial [Steroidobacteraceae bacterium]|nr:hypothetical protein [Steroidobacteraceae bacterium]
PSSNRATKRIRSSIMEHSRHGILGPPKMPKSVTHVLGRSVTYVPGSTSGKVHDVPEERDFCRSW